MRNSSTGSFSFFLFSLTHSASKPFPRSPSPSSPPSRTTNRPSSPAPSSFNTATSKTPASSFPPFFPHSAGLGLPQRRAVRRRQTRSGVQEKAGQTRVRERVQAGFPVGGRRAALEAAHAVQGALRGAEPARPGALAGVSERSLGVAVRSGVNGRLEKSIVFTYAEKLSLCHYTQGEGDEKSIFISTTPPSAASVASAGAGAAGRQARSGRASRAPSVSGVASETEEIVQRRPRMMSCPDFGVNELPHVAAPVETPMQRVAAGPEGNSVGFTFHRTLEWSVCLKPWGRCAT